MCLPYVKPLPEAKPPAAVDGLFLRAGGRLGRGVVSRHRDAPLPLRLGKVLPALPAQVHRFRVSNCDGIDGVYTARVRPSLGHGLRDMEGVAADHHSRSPSRRGQWGAADRCRKEEMVAVVRWGVVVLLVAHGLIQLSGVAKVMGWASSCSGSRSRRWLVSAGRSPGRWCCPSRS